MRRRRLAAAALLILPRVAAGAQTGDMSRPGNGQTKVRLIQAIPGEEAVDLVSRGDVLVANARFPSASDYQEVPAGLADLEVRKAGSGEVLAKASNVQLASGSISSLVAVGGIGEKRELLDISGAATAVSAAGGRRFALVLLIGGGLAAAAGVVVQQRRSTG